MKKKLLELNIILYIILYNVSLLYVGYLYGVCVDSYYPLSFAHFLVPAFYLMLVGFGCFQVKYHEFGKIKGYCFAAFAVTIPVLLHRYPRLLFYNTDELYFGARFVLSVLVIVIYVACIVLTYKEGRDLRKICREEKYDH